MIDASSPKESSSWIAGTGTGKWMITSTDGKTTTTVDDIEWGSCPKIGRVLLGRNQKTNQPKP